MIARFRRNWRLAMCLCVVSMGLMLLYLCTYQALGQTPPGGGGGDPTVQFSASGYSVIEGQTATITVTLSASSTQTVTVAYATSDESGQAGVDYTAASGTLTFSPGATSQSFTVSTLNDPNNTTDVTFAITLSSPTNATLGSPSTTSVDIISPNACPIN